MVFHGELQQCFIGNCCGVSWGTAVVFYGEFSWESLRMLDVSIQRPQGAPSRAVSALGSQCAFGVWECAFGVWEYFVFKSSVRLEYAALSSQCNGS